MEVGLYLQLLVAVLLMYQGAEARDHHGRHVLWFIVVIAVIVCHYSLTPSMLLVPHPRPHFMADLASAPPYFPCRLSLTLSPLPQPLEAARHRGLLAG